MPMTSERALLIEDMNEGERETESRLKQKDVSDEQKYVSACVCIVVFFSKSQYKLSRKGRSPRGANARLRDKR